MEGLKSRKKLKNMAKDKQMHIKKWLTNLASKWERTKKLNS